MRRDARRSRGTKSQRPRFRTRQARRWSAGRPALRSPGADVPGRLSRPAAPDGAVFPGSRLTEISRRPRRGIGFWGSSSRPTRWETDCSRRLSRRMPPGTAWWGWASCPTRWGTAPSRCRLSRRLWGWSCQQVRWSARRRARGHGQQSSRRRVPLWRPLPSVRPAISGAAERPAGAASWLRVANQRRAIARRPRVAQAMALGADRLGWQAGAAPSASAMSDRSQHWPNRCWQVARVSVRHPGCTCLTLPC